MDPRFQVSGRINKPVQEVFEAVADPKQLSGYFTTGGAKGRLETGVTVQWEFADFPGRVSGEGRASRPRTSRSCSSGAATRPAATTRA